MIQIDRREEDRECSFTCVVGSKTSRYKDIAVLFKEVYGHYYHAVRSRFFPLHDSQLS
jgi:hypothetical protein